MSKQAHLESLKLKHKELDNKIKEGYTTYINDEHLHKMKMEKLMLKDQIKILEREINEERL